jgi:hypothetical protein
MNLVAVLLRSSSEGVGEYGCNPSPDDLQSPAKATLRLSVVRPNAHDRVQRLYEVAAKLGCVPSTVERRLRLIRRIWEQELPS